MVCRNHMKTHSEFWKETHHWSHKGWLARPLAVDSDHLGETLTLFLLGWEATNHPLAVSASLRRGWELLGVHWTSWTCKLMSSNNFGKFQALLLQIFLLPHSLPVLSFWTSKYMYIRLILSHRSEICFFISLCFTLIIILTAFLFYLWCTQVTVKPTQWFFKFQTMSFIP